MTRKERSELFLSCDLVGSTNYKQTTDGWPDAFLAFYRQFPQQVGDIAQELKVDLAFDLWKPIGDELIFTVKIRHERHVYHAVRVWLEAMRRYETNTLPKTGMGTKGAAFIATFPGPDSESAVPRDPMTETSDKSPVILNDDALKGPRKHSRYLYDYFGPSIDTGFRIASACTPRYFTLAVEVAWALLVATHHNKKEMNLDDLVFLGPREMKGVWRGRDYPLFAIDRRSKDPVNDAIKSLLGNGLDPGRAEDLCRECVQSDGWISAIFLPESGIDDFKVKPVDSLAKFRQDNAMQGVETLPEEDPEEGTLLPDPPPFGEKNVSTA